jgi:hypothetical protein
MEQLDRREPAGRAPGPIRHRALTTPALDEEPAEAGSPRPVVLNVAITGHRANLLGGGILDSLEPIVDQVFRQLREAALKVQQSEELFCSETPAELRLHTALATGADQIAARSARSSGYSIRAMLPFSPDDYRQDFEIGDELDEFDRALDAADEIVALPGERSDPESAYVLVGKKLIEKADVIIAIWDGQEGRGPGGTAHVVELALASSVPVVHIDLDWSSDRIGTRILVDGKAIEPKAGSHLASDSYDRLLRGTLTAQPAPTETA